MVVNALRPRWGAQVPRGPCRQLRQCKLHVRHPWSHSPVQRPHVSHAQREDRVAQLRAGVVLVGGGARAVRAGEDAAGERVHERGRFACVQLRADNAHAAHPSGDWSPNQGNDLSHTGQQRNWLAVWVMLPAPAPRIAMGRALLTRTPRQSSPSRSSCSTCRWTPAPSPRSSARTTWRSSRRSSRGGGPRRRGP